MNIGTLKIKIMENKKCMNKQCFCDGSCKKPPMSLSDRINGTSSVFESDRLKRQLEKNKNAEIEFRIGVDKTDKNRLSYCFVRAIDKINIEILLLKTMDNEQEFDIEVLYLQKIFDAVVIEEK